MLSRIDPGRRVLSQFDQQTKSNQSEVINICELPALHSQQEYMLQWWHQAM